MHLQFWRRRPPPNAGMLACSNEIEPQCPSFLGRVRSHAAVCAFGVDELRQHSAEILLLGQHTELHTFRVHLAIEGLDIGNLEP